MKKKILIIGSGGREHALGWKLKQSTHIGKMFFAPGNGGTSQLGENISIAVHDKKELLKFAKKQKIDLIVVGPEAALATGIVDLFEKNNLKIFGPTKKAALIETSKSWATHFMKRHFIPHPRSREFTDAEKAKKFLRSSIGYQVVIKADGLAAGKGVIVHDTIDEAIQAIDTIMIAKEFGSAGNRILIQERLSGPELSVLAFTDGTTVIPLLSAQDHKRVFDNDKGPNTGGMGAYAPVPFVTDELMQKIQYEILQPTVDGMREEGIPYKGVLYAGLMLTMDGPKVIEFNARFGDPEVQPLMMLLKSDLYEVLMACIDGTLQKDQVTFRKGAAICVVIAAGGYPGKYNKGDEIRGLNRDEKDITVFHAGTKIENGVVVTDGGRVLGVTTHAGSFTEAQKKAYEIIGENGISFYGMQYRKDIGKNLYAL